MSDTVQRRPDAAAGNGREAPEPTAAPESPISLKRVVWPLLLSLIVLVVIGAYTFEPTEFRTIVERINPWWMSAAVLMVIVRVFLGGWRLDYISRGRLGRSGGVRGQLAWDFFSNVTPSAIGGAPFAALYVARDRRMDVGESTAFFLFSMLLDQLWFALTIPIVLIGSLYMDVIPASLGDLGMAGFVIYFIGILVWVGIFGYATLVRPEFLQRIASWILKIRWLRRFRGRVDRELRQLRHRARILRSQPPRFYLKGFLLTIGTWMSRYILLLLVIWAFLDDFDKTLALFRTGAMTLGSLIMPTPGGAGGVEGLYALFIGPLMPAAVVAPTLLVWRFLGYYLFVGLGVFLSTHHVQKEMHRGTVGEAPDGRAAATMHPDVPSEEVH